MVEARQPRRRVALVWCAWAFAVCSLLPVWELWYIGQWEGSGEWGPLWWVLWHVARPDPPPGEWPLLRAECQAGATITAVVMAVAGAVGFLLAGRPARRAEAGATPGTAR